MSIGITLCLYKYHTRETTYKIFLDKVGKACIIDYMNTIEQYIKYLDLKKPVVIKIKTRTNKHMDACYLPHYSDKTAKLLEHRITVYLKGACRDLDTLIAHELIHAWQEENKKTEIHGKWFKALAKDMEAHFSLEKIYIKNVDKNKL